MTTDRFLIVAAAALAAFAGCTPNDGTVDLEAGKAAYALHDLAKAAKKFEQAAKVAPDNVDALVYLARAKLELGDLEASRAAVAKAFTLEPKASDVRLLSAQLAWHAKDYERARETFLALANDTKLDASVRSQAWTGVGIVEAVRDRPHYARIDYFRAIRLDRKNASAWYHLGRLYRDGLGYMEAALEQFEFYVRIEKDADVRVQKVQRTVIPALKQSIQTALTERPGVASRNSSAAFDHLAKAEAAEKKGAWKTALAEYEAAFKADPLAYPAELGWARVLERTDPKKALELYKDACKLSPSAIKTLIHTGDLATRFGAPLIAQEAYSRAVAAKPDSTAALDGLVRSLRKNNQPKIAQAYQAYRDSLPAHRRK